MTAILSESSVVDIILGMAADAFLWRLIEFLGRVALTAADDDVQPGEGILGLIVVEVDFFPLGRRVALLALLTERSAVRLISAVAIDALRAQLLVLRHGGVADVAIEFGVRALEGKLEAHEMVELGDPPDIIAMTVTAGWPQPADMLVVRLMATGAILGYRVLQITAAMAIATADARMFALQGKPGFARVVEFLRDPVRG